MTAVTSCAVEENRQRTLKIELENGEITIAIFQSGHSSKFTNPIRTQASLISSSGLEIM